MSRHHAAARRSGSAPGRVRRSVGALGALAVLAGLVGGIPFVLVRFGSWPITGVPTAEQLRDLPSTVVTDEALVGLLTVLLWVAWAVFATTVVVELVTQLRDRARGHVRPTRSFGGPVRGAARYLVGSVLMSVGPFASAGAALPAGADPAITAVQASAAQAEALPAGHAEYDDFWSAGAGSDTGVGRLLDLAEQPSSEGFAPALTGEAAAWPDQVTVGRGDTAWSLAAEHLGDGARWRELWEVNRTRVQPDGAQWADADQPVRAGWVLEIGAAPTTAQAPTGAPAAAEAVGPDATTLAAEAPPSVQPLAAAPTVASEVTVTPGDNFWDLAEGQVAEAWGRAPTDAEVAPHWQALVEANRDGLAPPGDPNVIHPGQVFGVPTPPPDPQGVQRLVSAVERNGPAAGGTTSETETSDCGPEQGSGSVPAGSASAPASPATPPDSASTSTTPPTTVPSTSGTTAPDPVSPPTSAEAEVVPPSRGSSEAEPGNGGPRPDRGELPPDPGVTRDQTAAGDSTDRSATSADDGVGALLPVGLVGGGVALAGALALLERRRRAQQRHRRPGRVIPLPVGAGPAAERRLRWGADIAGAHLMDVALRAAAASAGATGLPRVLWAEAHADAALLALEQPSPAPPGFAGLDATRWITTSSHAELAQLASRAAAPAPTLVPVGTTDQGTELLIDLESGGVAIVDGVRDAVAGLLRAMVVALSTAPWSDQPRIVPVGLEPELGRLPGVASAPTLAEALTLAEQHADAAEAAVRSLRCHTVAQARAVGATPDAWDPLVVVSAVPPHDRSERRRLEDLALRRNAAVALVVVPPGEARLPGRRFAIGDHGWLAVEDVTETVRPRHLDGAEVAALVELLLAAQVNDDAPLDPAAVEMSPRRPPPPPASPPPVAASPPPVAPAIVATAAPGSEAHVVETMSSDAATTSPDIRDAAPAAPRFPGTPTSAGHAHDRLAELLEGVDVLVRVLGEVSAVRVTGPDGDAERLVPTRQRALEAVTYLALREAAVDREDLEISLFPDGANAAKTVYNTVSAARALLGDELFPPPEGGRYELSAAVVTDYGVFSELVAEADETEDALAAAEMLHQALGLVRGEPFTGVGRSYAWVGPHRGMIVAQVVDAAEELAEVRLASGDWRSAEWAARQGLRAFPSDERMYRLLMRTARAAGNIPGVQRVFRELCDVLADPEIGVEPEDTVHPETIELLEDLTGTATRERRLGA